MEYTVIIEKDPKTNTYTGQCVQVPAAISQGDTYEELMENMKDAISLVLDCSCRPFHAIQTLTTLPA